MDSLISFFDFLALFEASRFFAAMEAAARSYPTEIRLAQGIVIAGLGVVGIVVLLGGLVKRSASALAGAGVVLLAMLLVISGFAWPGAIAPDWQVLLKTGFIAVTLIFVTTRVAVARDNIFIGLITLSCIIGLLGLGGVQLLGFGEFNTAGNLILLCAAVLLTLFCGLTGLYGDPGAIRLLPGIMLCDLAAAGVVFLDQMPPDGSGPAAWAFVLLPFALFGTGSVVAVGAGLYARPRRDARHQGNAAEKQEAALDSDLILDLSDPGLAAREDEKMVSLSDASVAPQKQVSQRPAPQRQVSQRPARATPSAALPDKRSDSDQKSAISVAVDETVSGRETPLKHDQPPTQAAFIRPTYGRGGEDIDVTSDEFRLDEIDISQLDALEASKHAGEAFGENVPTPATGSVQRSPNDREYHEPAANPEKNTAPRASAAHQQPIGENQWRSPTSSKWPVGTVSQKLRWIWSSSGADHMPQRDIDLLADLLQLDRQKRARSSGAGGGAKGPAPQTARRADNAATADALPAPLSVRKALAPHSVDEFDMAVIGGSRPVDGAFDSVCMLQSGMTIRLRGQRRIDDNGLISHISGFIEWQSTGASGAVDGDPPLSGGADGPLDIGQTTEEPSLAIAGDARQGPKQDPDGAPGALGRPEMIAALRQGEFQPYFQPIVEMESREIIGFEVLARWHRAGASAPLTAAAFIDDAVALGLEMAIAEAILPRAVSELKLWHEEAPESGRFLCLNATAHALVSEKFADFILALLERHSLPSGSIVIEVTESHALEPKSAALTVAQKLKAAGIRLAIDDFGSGFANFDQLSAIEFDIVKTDRSLLAQAGSDKRAEKILQNLVDFAHNMPADVIIEGIENRSHLALARRVGGRLGQGFHFGVPAPVEGDDPNSGEPGLAPVDYTILR